jgi:mersacidin/lichenicidin family type 2 lantibiotic
VSTEDIIRAWRDEEYRESLNEEQRAALPESPVGPIDLSEEELNGVEGGSDTDVLTAVTAIITIVGSGSCSFFQGGTCKGDTSGCC